MLSDGKQVYEVTGRSTEECKDKVFKKYGLNYHIEGFRTDFKKGFLGLSVKEYQVMSFTLAETYTADNQPVFNLRNEEEDFQKNRQALLEQQNTIRLNSQINNLENSLGTMIEKLQNNVNSKLDEISVSSGEKHESILKIEDLLSQNEFTHSYINMIEQKIRSELSLKELDDFKLVQRRVVDWIGESISIAKEKTFRPPHVIIIVGPTGVGKTTTIAKMAAMPVVQAKREGKKRPEICIITIDSMRVGALEQISNLGDIITGGRKVQKAESAEDVKKIYEEQSSHVDYIFIDTSGYSPNDSVHIGNMKNVLNVDNINPDIYLSLCASTKASDLTNIIRSYEPFAYESVIVTKCDESRQLGNIISVLYEKHKSISYITDGQNVAKNIHKASVVEILKNLTGFEIDRIHIEDKFGVENIEN